MFFTLTISDNTDRVRKFRDIARLLTELGRHIRSVMGRDSDLEDDGGALHDTDGSVVGDWKMQKTPDRYAGYSKEAAEKIIEWARDRWESGTDDLEIDDEPRLAAGEDPGCWVSARVWVPYEQANICSTCKEDDSDEHAHCNGKAANGGTCNEKVGLDDTYHGSPCGTFCNECMSTHAKECPICASEFDLNDTDDAHSPATAGCTST
jgi:hypothetical protein